MATWWRNRSQEKEGLSFLYRKGFRMLGDWYRAGFTNPFSPQFVALSVGLLYRAKAVEGSWQDGSLSKGPC